jgi:hypothetical protein
MNAHKKIQKIIIPFIFIWMMLFTSACSGTVVPGPGPSEPPIERNLREFYNKLGGQKILGNFLSPVLNEGDYYYQFTEKVILVFDPRNPPLTQYHLHNVGLEMGFKEPSEPMPADPNTVYQNGFVVWQEALDLYNRLGRICDPISALHFNDEQKRYEQFFECFGVYRSENEPVGVVHLLDYGAWYCSSACAEGYSPDSGGRVLPTIFPDSPNKKDLASAESIIVIAADRIGRGLTGFPLTPTYISDDGTQYLRIYENVVFAVDRNNSARAYVLAITHDLGIRAGKPESPIKWPGAKFTPIQGDLGYTVRAEFYDFLALHGSYDTSGAPIMNEYAYDSIVNRQCFENLCLDYHKKAGESLKVRPAPYGYIYKQLYYRQPDDSPTPISPSGNVTIRAWEASSLIPSDQSQKISAAVYNNSIAVPDLQMILSVRMSDDNWVDYGPQPTDQKGQTVFDLSPIQAPNGTIILYQVCMYGIGETRSFCVMEDFTIWGNP